MVDELAIRKIETVGSLEELGLEGELLQDLKEAGVTAEELILATRNDIAWRSWLPDATWTQEANHLMSIPAVGEENYVKVMALVIKGGFIIYESDLSRKVRQIGAKNDGTVAKFLEDYEELEDLFPLD